jgi:integrase
MSVRRRTWTNADGSQGESWVVNYTDSDGKRRLKSFERKKDAITYHARVAVDVSAGTHTAESRSITVAAAGALWIKSGEGLKLERSTLEAYRRHLKLHITPLIGTIRLAQLTVAAVREFEDQLRVDRSAAMVTKVLTSLGSILSDAQERGLVAQNVVQSLRKRRGRGKERRADRRQKRKLKIGADIPLLDEMRTIIAHLPDRWRPLLLTAIFTGLRASELQGLRWDDVDLRRGELHVRQRADRWRVIGSPKSEDSERVIPLPPLVVSALREWKLACPKGEQDLVFPNGAGRVEDYNNIVERGWRPAQVAAGIIKANGKAKYGGLHALRHFFASWCINRKVDGGLELPPKMVQERLGHASITLTMDTYGHLFPRKDDSAELAAAEKAFLGELAAGVGNARSPRGASDSKA